MGQARRRPRLAVVLLRAACLSALLLPTGLLAAPPTTSVGPSSRQDLNPALRPQPLESKRVEDILSSPEQGPCPLARAGLHFRLTSVTFNGADNFRVSDLAPSYTDRIGQEIGLEEVCRIRDRAGEILFRHGILARVEVPEQTIAEGKLSLQVIEAHIVSVQVRGDAGPSQELVERFLDKLRGMKPFNIRQAQRYLLLASDVPGVRIAAALRPSAEGGGAVDLLVTVSHKELDLVTSVQNLNSKALGRFGAVARLDLNGLTRFGDRTTLVAYTSENFSSQNVAQLMSEIRLGSSGLVGQGSVTYALSAPVAELKPLNLAGRSLVASAGLSYPLMRTRRRNINIGGGFDLVDQVTKFGTSAILSEDHLRVFYLHADAEQDWRAGAFWLPPGSLSATLDYRHGVKTLGASDPAAQNLSRIGGHPDAGLVRGSVKLNLQVLPKLNAQATVQAQHAERSLLAYEQFSVGNLSIGRGYDPSSLQGDNGVGGSLDLRFGPFDTTGALKLPIHVGTTFLAFYDVADVSNRSGSPDSRTVHDFGGGISFEFDRRYRLDLTYAHPENKTSQFLAVPPSSRLLMSLTTTLF